MNLVTELVGCVFFSIFLIDLQAMEKVRWKFLTWDQKAE